MAIYQQNGITINPEKQGEDEDLLTRYFKLKRISRLPVFVYLIQRL